MRQWQLPFEDAVFGLVGGRHRAYPAAAAAARASGVPVKCGLLTEGSYPEHHFDAVTLFLM